jgi:hypothetical protein
MPDMSLSLIWDLLKGHDPKQAAKVSAYLLAPGVVLVVTIWVVQGRLFPIGLDRPVAIAELRTEIDGKNGPKPKRGVALIVEPTESEYRIPLRFGASTIWSSLNEEAARANSDRLALDSGGLKGRAPFLGVNTPVTVVVDGELGNEIQVPGGTERLDDWLLPSRRSILIVSGVLIACVFAFGMSLSTGFPSARGNENATGQVRT